MVIPVSDQLAPSLADNGGTAKYYFAPNCEVRDVEG